MTALIVESNQHLCHYCKDIFLHLHIIYKLCYYCRVSVTSLYTVFQISCTMPEWAKLHLQ